MSDEVPAVIPRKERLERERTRRRRRQLLWAVPVVALVIAAIVFVVTRSDSNSQRATRTRSGAGATGTTTERSTSSSTEPSSTTEKSSTTTAKPPPTVPFALPQANLKAPPDPPVGYYRSGKLYLEGSVHSEKVAAGYLRKARSVLGAGAIVMNMKRDPRVPVGTARVIVEEQFQFPTGSSALDPKFAGLLAVGADALKKIPESTLVITGYTDNVGSAEVNQSLSEQRAQLVVNFMVAHGVPANRVIAIGRGEADPIASNDTLEGRRKNRRIEGTLEGIKP